MVAYPLTLTDTKVRHLFPTPLIISTLPPDAVADINPRLRDLILSMEKTMPSQNASNRGGWQSDDKIMQWGGRDVASLLAAMSQLLDQVTVRYHAEGMERGGLPWKVNGWANVNRKGDFNAPHIHPGAYWSGVYYVATGDEGDTEAEGGAFQVTDPRGGLSLMYCPVLRVGLDGYRSAGNSESHQPRAGQCVFFPSWLSHCVTPYTGSGTRISLAFNFSV